MFGIFHMTNLRLAGSTLFVAALSACGNHHGFDYGSHIGVAFQKAGNTCLDVRNANLSAGQRMPFITSSTTQTSGELEITRKLDRACIEGETKKGIEYYEFKVLSGALANKIPAFALVGFSGAPAVTPAGLAADVDGDGQPEFFRSCGAVAGVHLTVWTGKPLAGPRKWQEYYYLGSDQGEKCSEAETKPDVE